MKLSSTDPRQRPHFSILPMTSLKKGSLVLARLGRASVAGQAGQAGQAGRHVIRLMDWRTEHGVLVFMNHQRS